MDLTRPPSAEERLAQVTRAVENLRAVVSGAGFDLETPSAPAARAERTALLRHLDDYLLPRLRRMDAPLLAVVGGSTGAGKSTLVNSLVRREVSRSGVLRPTTRSPVLVHHPHDSGAFLSQRILPGLGRVTQEGPEPMQPVDVHAPRITAIRLVPDDAVAPGLGILDAPDIDSVVDTNRDLAVQLLSAADLWVFVTTAARYADDLPWKMLAQAVARGTAVAVVLDRVPPASLQQVRVHLATMLRDRGLATAPMFTIPESPLVDGFLPVEHVQPLLGWLTGLARDPAARQLVARRTVTGAVAGLPPRAEVLAGWADDQNDAEARLLVQLDDAFTAARTRVADRLGDGSLVRGPVLARWQQLVSTGEFFAGLEDGRAARRALPSLQPLADALRAAVVNAVRAEVRQAARSTVAAWRTSRSGSALLDGLSTPDEVVDVTPSFPERAGRAVEEWAADAGARVADAAREHAARPEDAHAGPGLGLLTTLLAVSPPPGEDDAGAAEADDPFHVGRPLLAALVGDSRAAVLPETVRVLLLQRLEAVLDEEQARFMQRLDGPDTRAVRGDRLRAVAQALQEVGTWR